MKSWTIGAMALATGGGGVRPLEERTERMVDEAFDQGKKYTLVDVGEIPDDELVLTSLGTGGSLRVEQKLRWMNQPGFLSASGGTLRTGFDGRAFIHDQIMLKDKTFAPLNSWSELPGPEWRGAGLKRLKEIIGDKKIYSQLQGEVMQMALRGLITYPDKGWPIIDATGCGHRAVPECNINTLNIHDVPVCPAVITTSWGDLLVLERTLSWQRAEEFCSRRSTASSGDTAGLKAPATTRGTTSRPGSRTRTTSRGWMRGPGSPAPTGSTSSTRRRDGAYPTTGPRSGSTAATSR